MNKSVIVLWWIGNILASFSVVFFSCGWLILYNVKKIVSLSPGAIGYCFYHQQSGALLLVLAFVLLIISLLVFFVRSSLK